MDITERVYNHMRTCMEQHGFFHTPLQMARELNLNEQEVQKAVKQLEKLGKIKIIQIPPKIIIEFAE